MTESVLPVPADDEIDLAELFAAMRRRWRWPVAGLLAGCLFGGVVGWVTPQRAKIQLILNLNQGPQRLTPAVVEPSTEMSALSIPQNRAPVASSSEAKFEIEAISSLIGPQSFTKELEIESYKSGKMSDDNILIATLEVPRSQWSAGRRFMQVLSERYQHKIEGMIASSSSVEPGQPGWLVVSEQPLLEPAKRGRSLALAGLAGLVLGSAGALLADRRTDRVDSLQKLLACLGYPVWAKLPAPPWSQAGVVSQVAQLAQLLDPSLRWLVLSIGAEHPAVQPIVEALLVQASGVTLERQAPLLKHALLPVGDGARLGIVLIVERGFNSEAGLLEARRVLHQMTAVQQVGLVVVGESLPSELTV